MPLIRIGHDRLILLQTDRTHDRVRQVTRALLVIYQNGDPLEMGEQQLINIAGRGRHTIQIEPQGRHFEIAQRIAQCLHPQTKHRRYIRCIIQKIILVRRLKHRLRNLHRPERHRITGTETADDPLPRLGKQLGLTGDRMAGGYLGLLRVHFKLRHGHRRDRCGKLRKQDTQQSRGDFREIIFHILLQTCRQKGEAFQQTFDMRIRAFIATELKTVGNFRIALCKSRTGMPEIAQLALIMVEHFRVEISHRSVPQLPAQSLPERIKAPSHHRSGHCHPPASPASVCCRRVLRP